MFSELAIIPTAPAALDLKKPALAYLSNFAKATTRSTVGYVLNRQADLLTGGRIKSCFAFPWHLLRYEHTTALKTRLSELYKPSTVNMNLSLLRGILKACWRLGYMTTDDFQKATDIKRVRVDTLPAGREASPEELKRLFDVAALDRSVIGRRDLAVLSLLYGTGMRRGEISGLNYADYNPVENSLKVMGKGQKERIIYPPEWALYSLKVWLETRGATPGPLFCPADKYGGIRPTAPNMTPYTVHKIWRFRLRKAGLSGLTCHDMRRTYISNMLDSGVDIALVSKLVGHSNVDTTAKYDRRQEARKKAAAKTLAKPGE
jgi:integrase